MKVVVLECEIDDMNPQIFGVLMDKLYAAGALEVFYAGIQMKKNRPGTLMTIVAKPDDRSAMTEIVFRESTTIGIRYQELSRECLDREMVTIATGVGPVRFKVARRDGRVLNAQPEFKIWRNFPPNVASQSRKYRRSRTKHGSILFNHRD
jgi:uncharacterized protein (DUF111 family)